MNKKAKIKTGLTINVKNVCAGCTDLNISADALREIRELTEDFFIPLIVKWAGKNAENDGKKTIQERDYIVAKDYLTSAIKSYGLI